MRKPLYTPQMPFVFRYAVSMSNTAMQDLSIAVVIETREAVTGGWALRGCVDNLAWALPWGSL